MCLPSPNLQTSGRLSFPAAPSKFLRFTVFDVRGEKPPVTEEDGITYELTEQNGKTMLRLSQGDFSVMAEGEKYHRLSAEVWDRVLPKVKELAEK